MPHAQKLGLWRKTFTGAKKVSIFDQWTKSKSFIPGVGKYKTETAVTKVTTCSTFHKKSRH